MSDLTKLKLYSVEDVFETNIDYINWMHQAMELIETGNRDGNKKLSSLIPSIIEIQFGKTRSPRILFPKNHPDKVIVQVPEPQRSSPRLKGAIRESKLPLYATIRNKIEISLLDEIAIKLKLISLAREPDNREDK